MSDFELTKEELSKLAKEIKILKKEEAMLFVEGDARVLRNEMEDDLAVINKNMMVTIKKLNEHKANFKKLEEERIKLATQESLSQQKIQQCDETLKALEEALGQEKDLKNRTEIEAKIQTEKNNKENLISVILEIKILKKPAFGEIAKTLKIIVKYKRLLREFKEKKSSIYEKYKQIIQGDRLKKSAYEQGVSASEIFKAEAEFCKKEVMKDVLEEVKENEEFSKDKEALTPKKFEEMCQAAVMYILAKLEKNDSKSRAHARKMLKKAGWEFKLTGTPSVTGCNNLYLKLKALTYKKYMVCKKTMNLTLNDKPLLILTDFVLEEIRKLTVGAGFNLEKQALAHSNAKFFALKQSVILSTIAYMTTNHGSWSEGSTKEANKESGRDCGLILWAPMLAHILHQLMQAPALELAKSKKACVGMWNFENPACPKVAGFPDDLYPALQQLVYETYKEKIKPLFQSVNSSNIEDLRTRAVAIKVHTEKEPLLPVDPMSPMSSTSPTSPSANTNLFMLSQYKTSLQNSSSSNKSYPKRYCGKLYENFAKRVRCM